MIKLNEQEVSILGMPCFRCAGIAKLLIEAEVYENKAQKAEYEQAVFMHWAMTLYKEHGENWREEASKILKVYGNKTQPGKIK
jgi:hypothetical protein